MKKFPRFVVFVLSISAFILISCLLLYFLGPVDKDPYALATDVPTFDGSENYMNLSSTAFIYSDPIPARYSCRGENISPELSWDEPPAGTQSFVLLMEDPDAPSGTYDHWVLINLPPATRTLEENFQPAAPTIVGKNSSGQSRYAGPCPPSGTHRYFFRLYALDTTLSLTSSAYKNDVLNAMQGHVLAQAELMGTFSK